MRRTGRDKPGSTASPVRYRMPLPRPSVASTKRLRAAAAEARGVLRLANRRATGPVLKCLDSAVANAEHNFAMDADELVIAEAFADEGPTLKRWRPRARGRASRINKRTSHITIVVADDEEEAR